MIGGWDRDTEQLITSLHDLSQVASQLDSQRVTADASYAASWQVDKYLDYRISSIITPPPYLPTYYPRIRVGRIGAAQLRLQVNSPISPV